MTAQLFHTPRGHEFDDLTVVRAVATGEVEVKVLSRQAALAFWENTLANLFKHVCANDCLFQLNDAGKLDGGWAW